MIQKLMFLGVFFILLLSFVCIGFYVRPKSIGVYDYDGAFENSSKVTIQHFFTGWYELTPQLLSEIESFQQKKRTPLITLEPWPYKEKDPSGELLLKDIEAGIYDETIVDVCTRISLIKSKVILRFGHEMELKTVRYPWSNQDPRDYVGAYIHFVNLCRINAENIQFMWSPSGEEEALAYWPGRKYVDFIGLSVYSFQEYDEKYIGHQRSFEEIVASRYKRFQWYGKPIILAEVGVTGKDQYKKEWLRAANKSLIKYPFVRGLIYFHSYRPDDNWEEDLPIPDWRIQQSYLVDF